ncbi:hypothetical protein [Mesorhizobium sp. SP-1A]|uniref:hypothetical protein n=1 Tax=Mesorhizobium sp. SP-1A TaxID=3077840 RepID=UPI0028F6C298|nr:hypothetical protein [Mesorhizobium sp. SP-1A]
MIRVVAVVLFAVVLWALLVRLARWLRHADIDWTGVTFAVGFVVLAFWLRHVTGMG